MISLPGSLSGFGMSSAPAKNLRGMPDSRPKNPIHPRLSHSISTPTRIRSAFFLRRTQLGQSLLKMSVLTSVAHLVRPEDVESFP